MVSNCSVYRLRPLDPAVDPAYQDGRPPQPRRVAPTGMLDVALPVARMPSRLEHSTAISLDDLEEEIEREARREERG